MWKKNPDAIALTLIVCFMAVSAAAPWKRVGRPGIPRQEMKVQLRRGVASLKQCIRPVIHHKPIQRSL
jgi:hypothetical protein